MSAFNPRIAARAVRPVVAGIQRLGFDSRSLTERAGIDPSQLADPDGVVPFANMAALWDRVLSDSGDPCIGLHIAEAVPLASLDFHAYAMRSSRCLRNALRLAVRFHRLIHETTILEFDEEVAAPLLRHRLPGGGAVPRQPAEFLVTLWLRLAHEVAPGDWYPKRVAFVHASPDDRREHQRVFGSEVTYGASETEIQFPISVIDRPNPDAEPSLLELLKRYAGTLRGFSEHPTVAERVRESLDRTWPYDPISSQEMARHLAMSSRSLSRALMAEGTTFTAVRTAVRMERADALLARSDATIAEIAFAAGFAELSAFYRAFSRERACSPAEWRKKHRH